MQKRYYKKKAQDNLRQNKGVLSYDAHDEKQVYYHIIKNFARISEAKTREILKLFCLDIEAVKIAKLSNISRQSVNKIINQIRILIAKECEKISKMQGEIEVDKSNLLI